MKKEAEEKKEQRVEEGTAPNEVTLIGAAAAAREGSSASAAAADVGVFVFASNNLGVNLRGGLEETRKLTRKRKGVGWGWGLFSGDFDADTFFFFEHVVYTRRGY